MVAQNGCSCQQLKCREAAWLLPKLTQGVLSSYEWQAGMQGGQGLTGRVFMGRGAGNGTVGLLIVSALVAIFVMAAGP